MLVAVVDVDAEATLIINYKVVDVVKAGVVLLFQLSIDLVALVDVISVAVVNAACVGNCCCALDVNPIESVNLLIFLRLVLLTILFSLLLLLLFWLMLLLLSSRL